MSSEAIDLKSRKRVKEIDAAAGASLRQLRLSRNMSQTALGDAVGLTFQQIQKYEKGSNRISISRLCQFAEILDFSPVQFFENLHEITDREPDAVAQLMQTMSSPQISRIVENHSNVDNDIIIGRIGALIETIVKDRTKSPLNDSTALKDERKIAS